MNDTRWGDSPDEDLALWLRRNADGKLAKTAGRTGGGADNGCAWRFSFDDQLIDGTEKDASFLERVQKPSRYVGGEHGEVVKSWDAVNARLCLAPFQWQPRRVVPSLLGATNGWSTVHKLVVLVPKQASPALNGPVFEKRGGADRQPEHPCAAPATARKQMPRN